MKIYLASDHAGFELKEKIKDYLLKKNLPLEDLGTHSSNTVNWAEYGAKAAQKVSENPKIARGIIVCGSGLGMSIVCNKFKNVRAALCNDRYAAEMSRRHNNANILNIGGRVVDVKTALEVVEIWLNTPFDGGRHQKRIDYITEVVEAKNFK